MAELAGRDRYDRLPQRQHSHGNRLAIASAWKHTRDCIAAIARGQLHRWKSFAENFPEQHTGNRWKPEISGTQACRGVDVLVLHTGTTECVAAAEKTMRFVSHGFDEICFLCCRRFGLKLLLANARQFITRSCAHIYCPLMRFMSFAAG